MVAIGVGVVIDRLAAKVAAVDSASGDALAQEVPLPAAPAAVLSR